MISEKLYFLPGTCIAGYATKGKIYDEKGQKPKFLTFFSCIDYWRGLAVDFLHMGDEVEHLV